MKTARRILVGLKTLETTEALVDTACRLAGRGASLLLIHVIELPDPTPLTAAVPDLDALATRILRKGKTVARRHRVKVDTLVLRAHGAASALLDEIATRKVDLAVLGYHRQRTLGELIMGTTAQHLARQAPCRLVLDLPPRG